MRLSFRATVLAITLFVAAMVAREASAVRYYWCMYEDMSYALIIVEPGETFHMPTRDGGTKPLTCYRSSSCWLILEDKKVSFLGYEIWVWNNLPDDLRLSPPGLEGPSPLENRVAHQTAPLVGTINYTSATFDVYTDGFPELNAHTSVSANYLGSPTGFQAQVGSPGDQLSQGGTLSFTTEWQSDEAIGVDLATGEEIVLGHFTLDVSAPLTEFTMTPQFLRFTAKEVYTFSTGQQIEGVVTSQGPISYQEIP